MLLLTPDEIEARDAKAARKAEATPPPSKEVGFLNEMSSVMAAKHPD